MRSRHPAKTRSLFRLSSLWLLAFRLDKRLTSLPSLDERAAAPFAFSPFLSSCWMVVAFFYDERLCFASAAS
jgi:hypothetical protein